MTFLERYARDPRSAVLAPVVGSIGALPWRPNTPPLWSDPTLLKETAQEMAQQLKDIDIDVVLGLATRGVPYGVGLALELEKPFTIVRKEPRGGGKTGKMIEGVVKPGQHALLVDDSFGEGTSSRRGITTAVTEGLKPIGVAVLMDAADPQKRDAIQDAYATEGLQIFSCFKMEDLGNAQITCGSIPPELAPLVKDYLTNRTPWQQDAERWRQAFAAYRTLGITVPAEIRKQLADLIPEATFLQEDMVVA